MDPSNAHFFVIGKTETRIIADSKQLKPAYANQRALLCQNAISSELLSQLVGAAAKAHFTSDQVAHLGHRWIEKPSIVGAAIQLVLNRAALLDWLKAVTGCNASGGIEGRLVETRPGGIDQLSWHRDTVPNARYEFGVTLHLRPCQYEGGAFEMRDSKSKQPLFRHYPADPGDLLIFEVDHRSEHRVMPVESGEPRLVFTGWFIANSTN
jgi:2OG-Fe(II) oxygenase superfamily